MQFGNTGRNNEDDESAQIQVGYVVNDPADGRGRPGRDERRGHVDQSSAGAVRPEQAGVDGVQALRCALGIQPVGMTVDAPTAGFAAATPYHRSACETAADTEPADTEPADPNSADTESAVLPRAGRRPDVLMIRSGPSRIGQRIDFGCSRGPAPMSLGSAGYRTVMINRNPESVSTGYGTFSRLKDNPLYLPEDTHALIRRLLPANDQPRSAALKQGIRLPTGLCKRLH